MLDLLGDLGGVVEIIMLISQMLLSGSSEHSFVLKAIEKLYYVKSGDEDMFRPSEKQIKKLRKTQTPRLARSLTLDEQRQVGRTHSIKFSMR